MENKKKTKTCKVNMVRKYGEETQTIKAEVELHRRLKMVKKEHTKKKNDQIERSSKMSRENAVKLMQRYEREAEKGRKITSILEDGLTMKTILKKLCNNS